MIDSGTLLQGRFLIQETIGMGGMGAVYRAIDQKFGSVVAIKETFYGDTDLAEAFEREARLLNNLHHPILPHVSDYFTEEDGHFLVMEYIEGEDLSEILKRGQIFPVDVVVGWALDILDGLDYLHSQEPPVIHRDIKPNNLKLTSRGRIVLLDFGMAKETSGNTLGARSVFGYSRRYSPLEQIEGTGTDARSDIFSLGASIYHLITGQPPADALARASAIVAGRPDPLQLVNSINSAVPEPVAAILNSALAINSDNRFESARAMSNALEYAIQFGVTSPRQTDVETDPVFIPESENSNGAVLGAAAGPLTATSPGEDPASVDRGLIGEVPSLRPPKRSADAARGLGGDVPSLRQPVLIDDEHDLEHVPTQVSDAVWTEPIGAPAAPHEEFVPPAISSAGVVHPLDTTTSREPWRVRRPARQSSVVWVPVLILCLAFVLFGTYRGLISGVSESNVSTNTTPTEINTTAADQSVDALSEPTESTEVLSAELPVTDELTAGVPATGEGDAESISTSDTALDLKKGPIAVRSDATRRRSTSERKPEPKNNAAPEPVRSTERRAQNRRSTSERPARRVVEPAFERPAVSSIEMIMTGVPYERGRRSSVDEADAWIEEDRRRRRFRRMMRQNRRWQQPY